ncbi:MAG: hypothetical protein DSO00_04485 [Archaeoglobi archaeon]|jgi:hypothetical protein|nr:MAG: hypothetical protein DSO00_04485 [Archaeoglobi archaeon]
MLSILVVAESTEWHNYKDLEECLLNDYHVEFTERLSSESTELSKLEFSHDIFFYLKIPETSEISAISRLLKSKIFIFFVKKDCFSPLPLKNELLPVADKILLKASAMRGKMEYFRGVDEILALNVYHIEPKEACEVILNGNKDSRAMLGDIVFRAGKNVIFGVRKNNIVAFSADIFSNECLRQAQNCRFFRNLLSDMLTGVEFY